MADVVQRVWRSGPRKVKRTAWGYTLQAGGKQVRRMNAAWTKEQAEQALANALLGREAGPAPAEVVTFGAAAARYLATKKAERKRSIRDDEMHLKRLVLAFGAETPLTAVTAAIVSDYKTRRANETPKRGDGLTMVSAATVNRELATLRHLLRLAVDEWEILSKAPAIRLLKEPEGRIRWLEPDEEARLLATCRRSLNRHLLDIVTVAMETGMRFGEIMGMTWERVDLTRGVFKLERTKSGRRREVPMRQAIYALLTSLPEPREGRLWPDQSIRTAFENAVEAAGIEDFTFHDLRHHFASWFIMRGGGLPALREILGHRDIKLTVRYANLSPGHLRTEIDKTAAPAPASAEINATATHDAKIEESAVVTA